MNPGASDGGDLILEDRFAIVPEWLLDAEVGDCAVRLYAVLLRYGQSSGSRMPSRSTLARRLHKLSTDTVDRAMKELVGLGAVRIEHRYDGAQRLTNAYHLRTSRPGHTTSPTPSSTGSRTNAATPTNKARGGRTDAGRVAADSGQDPEHLTESTSSPCSQRPHKARQAGEQAVAETCGITDWPEFVEGIQQVRRELGAPATRWAGPCLAAALHIATQDKGWPVQQAANALTRVAADPETRSPMRVAEAGPWWDEPTTKHDADEATARMEQALTEAGGARVRLQNQARTELTTRGLPVTRAAVTRRAYELLIADTGAA